VRPAPPAGASPLPSSTSTARWSTRWATSRWRWAARSPSSVTRQSRASSSGSEHLIRCTLLEAGAPASLYDAAWARYQHHYLAINGEHSAVYPGVIEGLQALRAAGLRLACITNKPGSFAQPLMVRKGLAGFFDHAFGGDAFPRKKPDPMPLVEACKALGSTPAHTLMVGDSSNDAKAARAAGCPVVLVRYGYNHGEPVETAGADALIDRLDELPALLAHWASVGFAGGLRC
jgi:phosphoglycolate phosphatase